MTTATVITFGTTVRPGDASACDNAGTGVGAGVAGEGGAGEGEGGAGEGGAGVGGAGVGGAGVGAGVAGGAAVVAETEPYPDEEAVATARHASTQIV